MNLNSEIIWKDTCVSPCETFHLFREKPLYTERYVHVLKYHEPGLAPVKDGLNAFHINIQGLPAYSNRFMETFGFYEGLAAVRSEDGWFHINEKGESCYTERYLWCGNFQEGFCPVKDKITGLYFHINRKGERVYQEQYPYVGDFKEGCAVICNELGLHTHIDYQGKFIHGQWFVDLDLFHKGFARAKNSEGWFHINKAGQRIYKEHYASIEPFYNGAARVETVNGMLITINTQGEKISELRTPLQKPWQALSGDMVGFWRTETIAAAVRLGIFDFLPAKTSDIALKLKASSDYLERLLRALWELNLICLENENWQLTEKGHALSHQAQKFMAAAAIMWSDVNGADWKSLPEFIRIGSSQNRTLFKVTASDEKLQLYHRAIDGYALEDFLSLKTPIGWEMHSKMIGVGRTAKTWLEKLLQKNADQEALLLGETYVLKHANIEPSIAMRYRLQTHDILQPWPEKADGILLPKVLHYWSDDNVIKILTGARQALLPGGKIYVIEMVLKKDNPNGSLLGLNMLVESGGQLRFLSDWENLSDSCQLNLQQNIEITPWLTLLIFEPRFESVQ